MTAKALITVSASDSEEDFGYATTIKGSMVDIGVLLSVLYFALSQEFGATMAFATWNQAIDGAKILAEVEELEQ